MKICVERCKLFGVMYWIKIFFLKFIVVLVWLAGDGEKMSGFNMLRW